MKKFLSILLAVMMVLSTVSFAAPSLAGTYDAAVEMPVVEEVPAVEETADLAADLSDDVNTYGELIFELNFDNLTSISSQSIMFTDAGYINPEAEQYDYLSAQGNIEFNAYPTYGIKERAAGDKYLEIAGGTGYAVAILHSGTDRGFQTQEGVYTLTADIYRPDNFPITTRFSGSSTEDTPHQDFSGLVDGGWGKMILRHDPECFGNGGHAVVFDSVADAKNIKFHRNGGTDDKTVGYDNIRLYYKPFVEVTVKTGYAESVSKVPSLEPIAVSSLIEGLTDLGPLYEVEGVKIGGKTYEADDYYTFTENTTVELLVTKLTEYVNDKHGLMIFDIDFEQHDIGADITAKTSDFKIGDYATPIAKKVMSHDPSNWHLNESGFDLKVVADPANASNKVAGVTGATSTGYPVLQLNTFSNGARARYGFIEDNDLIWTIEYNYYDTNNKGVAMRFGGKSSVSENEGFEKWETVEDACTEYATGRAASTWYTQTGVMNPSNYKRMGGSDEISFIKMHAAAPDNSDIYYDNVRVYYRPGHVDLAFDANGMTGVTIANANLENVANNGILVSDLIAQAGIDYSEVSEFFYSFKGLSLDPRGEKVYGLSDTITFYEDSTVYLIFEEVDMTGWMDENGILLYEIDLDGIAEGTVVESGALVSTFGRVNPFVAGSDKWYINISQFSAGTVESGALKFTKTAAGQWAQIQISNEKNNPSILISDGTITKFADMKIAATTSGVTLGLTGYARKYNTSTGKWEGTTNNQNSVQTQQTVVSGEWYSLSGSKTLEGQEYNSESCTIYLPTYPAQGGIGDTFYLDNLKMYWKPSYVNLTVYGGSNSDYETVNLKNVSTNATVEDVIALLPGSAYGKITSLADMNGKKISELGLITDAKFVAVWTPWEVVEGGQEFPEDKKGVSGNSMWASGGYAYAADVGDGGGDTTTAVHNMYGNAYWSEGGNMYRTMWTPQIGDPDIGEGDDDTNVQTFAIPAGRTHFNVKINGEDCIRENIKVSLAAGSDAQYILVKYRYTNLPNLAELVANNQNPAGYEYTLSADGYTINYTDRWGEAASASLKPAYGAKYYVEMQSNGYEYAGGMEFHKNELMVEGEWLYDMIPVTEKITTNGAKCVLVQHVNFFHNEIIEYDYVRFVKLSDEEEDVVLPELGEDGPSVVLDNPGEITATFRAADGVKTNAIRFKGGLTSYTAKKATDIGWLVATKDYADANGFDLDAQAASEGKIIKAMNRDAKVDLTTWFEEDDENVVYAAALKNIPEDKALVNLVVKQFVMYGDDVYYGEMKETCLFDVAVRPYIDYYDDGYTIYNMVEDGIGYEGYYLDGVEGDFWYNDNYDMLPEAQQEYVVTILKALLGE